MVSPQIQLESKLLKGFADKSRLSILQVIMDKPTTVSKIIEQTGLSQSNTSMHLACLLDCGLVEKRREGRNIYYSLIDEEVSEIITIAQKLLTKHTDCISNCENYTDEE